MEKKSKRDATNDNIRWNIPSLTRSCVPRSRFHRNRSHHRPIAPDFFSLQQGHRMDHGWRPHTLTMIACVVSHAWQLTLTFGVHLGLRAAISRSGSAAAGKMRSVEPMDDIGINGKLRGECSGEVPNPLRPANKKMLGVNRPPGTGHGHGHDRTMDEAEMRVPKCLGLWDSREAN